MICSDSFFRFVPISASCLREHPDLFQFVPICSHFFRFVPIYFQNKSEQIREPLSADPFCKSPILTGFYASSSPPENGQYSPHFGAMSFPNYAVNLEKGEKIHWRRFKNKSSGDLGPATTLFSIANSFVLVFFGGGVSHNYRGMCCKRGYRTDVPV